MGDWVSTLTTGAAESQAPTFEAPTTDPGPFPEPSSTQVLPGDAEHALNEYQAAASLQAAPPHGAQAATPTGGDVDLNAWLEELQASAKPFDFSESQNTSGALNSFAEPH